MAGHKRERYKTEPRISVPFMLELECESKLIKKLLVIKEICSWLPLGLDGGKVCSQKHISLITNSFLMILLSHSNSSIKGTEILGSVLYLSLLRPAIFVCMQSAWKKT